MPWGRPLAAEFIGTLVLVATVVGSGIMGETMAGGNAAVALLGNTLATGAILVVLIRAFADVSGAHFNPAVTLAFAALGEIAPGRAAIYIAVQVAGGLAGTALAHAMFELPAFVASTNARVGPAQWLAEAVATAGLLLAIFGTRRSMPAAVPWAVGLYITAGYWFTASTSFANPAVTIARAFTDTFSGIRPEDAPWFVVAQLVVAVPAAMLWRWLFAPAEEKR
ncbi:MAG: MIP/aquaporin family protein [Alphaproteobacteria bacterium]